MAVKPPDDGSFIETFFTMMPCCKRFQPNVFSLQGLQLLALARPLTIVLALIVSVLVVGCGGGDDDDGDVGDDEPVVGLSYTSPKPVYTVDVAVPPNYPITNGTEFTTYTVEPSLPQGLNLNTATGVLSGTSTEIVYPARSYTVTATGGNERATFAITIRINAPPPTISYAKNLFNFTVGQAVPAIAPSVSNAIGFAIKPALPPGLTLNPSTGEITGTPRERLTTTKFTISAANASGQTTTTPITITVREAEPATLPYKEQNPEYTVGTQISDNAPISGGWSKLRYSVEPSLPAGLQLNTTTGAITGVPTTTVYPTKVFTITARDSEDVVVFTAILKITIYAPNPAIAYSANQHTLTKGVNVANIAPTASNTSSFGISGELPTGLIFNTSTGEITGTPTAIVGPTPYVITAENGTGQKATAILILTVNDQAPSKLSYATQSSTYTRTTPIASNIPSNEGGIVTLYSITPSLPSGLFLDALSGTIAGTPNVTLYPAQSFTVTGTNSGGSTTAVIQIGVNDLSPTVSYSGSPFSFVQGIAVSGVTATSTNATSFAVSATVPAGLSFNSATGEITGTPTDVTAARSYTVTATNSTGQTATATLVLTVNDRAPSNLSYSSQTSTYTRTTPIASNFPSNDGGVITLYSITPSLPSGLSFNSLTGIISGTPTVTLHPAQSFTVTGTNSGGSTTSVLQIGVNDLSPTISYPGSPFSFEQGVAVSGVTATSANATSFAVSGTLPAGLHFNTSTGEITGTPTAVITATPYTVTATNSTGQTATAIISITVTDVTPPSISLSGPSATSVDGSGSITYSVTYSGADSITLSTADVTLSTTGTATCSKSISGSGTTSRTITLSSCTGTGSVGVLIASGTAADTAGNLAAAVTSSTSFATPNGPATSLAISSQPTNNYLTTKLSSVAVHAVDENGYMVGSFTGTVSIAIDANPGSATLGGTTSVAPVAGIANFTDLTLDQLGTGYTLRATTSGLSSIETDTFNVTIAPYNMNLLHHLKLDDNANTNSVADVMSATSSNLYSGTYYNNSYAASTTASRTTTGRINSGFNMSSRFIIVSSASEVDFGKADPFSISLWIKGTLPGSGLLSIFGKYDTTPGKYQDIKGYYAFVRGNTGKLYFSLQGQNNNGATVAVTSDVEGNTNILNGQWHHLVFVNTAASGLGLAGELKIYIDGVEETYSRVASNFDTNPSYDIKNGGWQLKFGLRGDQWVTHFPGQMDDIRVYNAAMSAATVQELYSAAP